MRGKELRIMSKPRMGFNFYLNLIAVSEAVQKINSQIYYVASDKEPDLNHPSWTKSILFPSKFAHTK